jgi:hypothetical protein
MIDLLEFVANLFRNIDQLVVFLTMPLDKLLCNKLSYNLKMFPKKFHHLIFFRLPFVNFNNNELFCLKYGVLIDLIN